MIWTVSNMKENSHYFTCQTTSDHKFLSGSDLVQNNQTMQLSDFSEMKVVINDVKLWACDNQSRKKAKIVFVTLQGLCNKKL